MSDPVQASGAPRQRRRRSAAESLLSIALGLEAALMFFVSLAVFRFAVLPTAVALAGGAAVIVLLLIVGRLVRFRFGVWLGWALQLGLVAIGFLLPLMFFIGAGFAAIWIYCYITGTRLDRRNAALVPPPSPTHTEE